MKEFLSCIRELDVHVQYKVLHKASNKNSSSTNTRVEVHEGTPSNPLAEDKLGEQWWLKSNYISTLNLLEAMQILGPLINY
jgi:N-glycosylase/DNA lyase